MRFTITRAVSGLSGLAIVRHAVVSHDGSIEVDSVLQVGSTFTVRLPVEVVSEGQ